MNNHSDKKNFRIDEVLLKTFSKTAFILLFGLSVYAQKNIHNELIDPGIVYFKEGNFKEASKYFNSLLRNYPNDAEVMYWFARCYEEADEKQKAADLYLKAYKYNKKAAPDILYKVGKAYQLKLDYKKALTYYQQYKTMVTPDVAKELGSTIDWELLRVNKMISECESGLLMLAKPSKHKIINLGKIINTPYEEYTPLITADNKKLFFTSRRPGGINNIKDTDNSYFEDIWYSVKDVKGKWKKPVNIGPPINSDSHDACIALSPDGKQLFLYNTSDGGDIYSSIFVNGRWSDPKSIGKKINSKHKEPSMSISADNNTIYFSSDRPGGLGGLDIYWSKKDAHGNWDEAVNMGPIINTAFEDDGPFISYNGKTLYFCSNGHNSIGGFDIFFSTYDDKANTWSKPVNMGYPINSPDDDIFFVIAADKRTAYYASGQKGGLGEKDIFTIDIDTNYFIPKKQALASSAGNKKAPAGTPMYTGKVTDESGAPLECVIHVKKYDSEEKPKDFFTKPDGTFQIPLAKGAIYGINAEKSGFLFFSHIVNVSNATTTKIFSEDFQLTKPKEGQKIILKNISYQIGRASLTKSSFHEVDLLYNYLLKNPSIKIEISGHTDNLGSKELNKQISTERAKTVYGILVKKGIAASRLTFAGYGSEKPIATNNTADGKRKNRRTEFEITQI